MASTKAYQARKRDIAALNLKLAETEYQLRKALNDLHNSTSVFQTIAEENRALAAEWVRLKTRCGILETYIRHAYWYDLDSPAEDRSVIPSCLKPLDAIKYAGGEPLAFPPKED